jgi:phosphomannomutase
MKKAKTINQLMQESQVSFGTSGARGLVSKMTDEICYSYTTAFIMHLKQSNQLGKNKTIAIAGDLRPSTKQIMNACAKAILDMGLEVINCGYIASPAIALYGINHKIATIMVTGSHIPDDRNGIKFNTPRGEILKQDEVQIKEQLIPHLNGLFSQNGNFKTNKPLKVNPSSSEHTLLNTPLSEHVADNSNITSKYIFLPEINKQAKKEYINRFISLFSNQALAGLNIGVYQHSGVARDDIVTIVKALGANVTALLRTDVFMPVDTEAIREEDCKLAKQWSNDQHFDAIITTDGDADRPLISDENGNWLRGDMIGILCAQFLGIKHIVTPISSNSAVEKSQLFDSVSRTQIGSPYVIAGMNKLVEDGHCKIAGYEANGGFLMADDINLEGKKLTALPTRDAVIVLLSLLLLSKQKNCTISQLSKDLPRRFTYSDRIKNIPTEVSQKIINAYLKQSLGKDQQGKEKIEKDFNGAFSTPSSVVEIDNTDGLRIYFKNQNIIHFRPSGNAPEFRCYTEANEIKIAQSINNYCLQKIKKLAQES